MHRIKLREEKSIKINSESAGMHNSVVRRLRTEKIVFAQKIHFFSLCARCFNTLLPSFLFHLCNSVTVTFSWN